MDVSRTPGLERRRAVALGAAGLAAWVARPGPVSAQSAASGPTPAQIRGPYYPDDWSGDVDHDLVRVHGEAAQAKGTVTHLRGRLLDRRGEPLRGASVEIWQCDAAGFYRHPNDRPGMRDPGFRGHGRVRIEADGRFAFRTIKPVPYPGRTPHIHVLVRNASGAELLVTQLYVAGEPGNERDGLFRRLPETRAREALLMHLVPADRIEPGALLAERDIVLG